MDGGGEMETVLFSIGILAIIAGMMTRHYMLGGIVGAGSFLLYFGLPPSTGQAEQDPETAQV